MRVVFERLRENLVRLLLAVAGHRPKVECMSGGPSNPKGPEAVGPRGRALHPKRAARGGATPPPAVRVQDGHITVRVTPSQAVSDLLVEALGPGKD